MTEDYFRVRALNFSLLADFQLCPDAVRVQRKPASYFENGKAFELILQDLAQGTKFFHERYFVADVEGGIPEKVVVALERNLPLSEQYNLNGDGSRSKASTRLHTWLDACQENPGKVPVSKSEHEMLCRMADNLLMAPLFDTTVGNIISGGDYQVPVYWQEKKALFDIETTWNDQKIIFDVKCMASLSTFRSGFFSRYWIQDIHYMEGTFACRPFEDIHSSMIFLVATKEAPYVAQPLTMQPERRVEYTERYQNLCEQYFAWLDAGKPACGWKPLAYL